MKIPLRIKSTAFALVIGVVIGMLVPMMYTWAQNQGNQGTIQTPFGPIANPRTAAPDPCEQYYQEAMTANTTPNASAASEKATLYLACREHSRTR